MSLKSVVLAHLKRSLEHLGAMVPKPCSKTEPELTFVRVSAMTVQAHYLLRVDLPCILLRRSRLRRGSSLSRSLWRRFDGLGVANTEGNAKSSETIDVEYRVRGLRIFIIV